MQTPKMKHLCHKGRRYRISDDGVYQWGTMDDSYMMAWRKVKDEKLAQQIRAINESPRCR